LFHPDKDGRCSKIAHTVKGQHKVFNLMHYFGCECDIVVLITNDSLQHEAISRSRQKLAIITGPDLISEAQFKLKLMSAAEHSYNSLLWCPSEPCPWSEGWIPLVEHLVVCANCGDMMEKNRKKCSQCGQKYVKPSVFTRASVRSTLKEILEEVSKASITNEELDDLCGNDEVTALAKQYNEARENDDKELWSTFASKLLSLISSNSPSATREAVRSTLKMVLAVVKKTSATDKDLDDLCGNDEVVKLAKQFIDARGNNDKELEKTSGNQLIGLITSISSGASRSPLTLAAASPASRQKRNSKKCLIL